ncbi:MAG TPA: 5-oxoprolinase subunit PxpA [Trueperaceae bacterium]
MARHSIDLNADAGESYGPWPMGRDEELFPLVTSVNLACGFHAGDPLTIQRSVRLAYEHGTAVGAHPGFPDRVGFGRREMKTSAEEAHADVLYQLGALSAFAELHHVKPHGALYMQMGRDEGLCRAVAAAVKAFAEELPLVVLAGSSMEAWARAEGVRTVAEAFPDRGYLASGLLASRALPGSLIRSPEAAAARALAMTRGEPFETLDGARVRLEAETLCIHGDNPEAVEIARAVREALEEAGVEVAAF